MHPLRFSGPNGELHGVFHPPAARARPRLTAALLCPPLGAAAVRSHKIYRFIADRMSRLGFGVLRFDWTGSGESDGECMAGGIARWRLDIQAADSQLRTLAGVDRCLWLGLQLGGTVVVATAPEAAHPPSHVVAWDPVLDGSAYLEGLEAEHVAYMRAELGPQWTRRPAGNAGRDYLGIEMSQSMAREILDINPGELLASLSTASATRGGLVLLSGTADPRLAAPAHQWPTGFRVTSLAGSETWDSDEAMNSASLPMQALAPILDYAETLE